MTVSVCRYNNLREPLEEKTIRFLFVFKLKYMYFEELEKIHGRAFAVQSYFAKSFYKNLNSRLHRITRGRVKFRAATCFPFPKISENTIQNKKM